MMHIYQMNDIQIQHLLKLNSSIEKNKTFYQNSNTTLVKVKCKLLQFASGAI